MVFVASEENPPSWIPQKKKKKCMSCEDKSPQKKICSFLSENKYKWELCFLIVVIIYIKYLIHVSAPDFLIKVPMA